MFSKISFICCLFTYSYIYSTIYLSIHLFYLIGYFFIFLFFYFLFFNRFLDFKQQETEMREIREDEEYERDAGDGSFFAYLTNGCFRKNKNKNKYKYVCQIEVKVW